MGGENRPAPRVINTDKHAAYPLAIAGLQSAGDLADNCQHRPVQYLNNVLEQGIVGRSSAGGAQANISDRFGELGARSPAMRRFI
jgi:hypothetical protein